MTSGQGPEKMSEADFEFHSATRYRTDGSGRTMYAYSLPWAETHQEAEALRDAVIALLAAARERDRMREALESLCNWVDRFLEDETGDDLFIVHLEEESQKARAALSAWTAPAPSYGTECPMGSEAVPEKPGQGTPTPAPKEPFEEWHRRECPAMQGPAQITCRLPEKPWSEHGLVEGTRFAGKTCREVYASEHPAPPEPRAEPAEESAADPVDALVESLRDIPACKEHGLMCDNDHEYQTRVRAALALADLLFGDPWLIEDWIDPDKRECHYRDIGSEEHRAVDALAAYRAARKERQ